MAVKQVVEEVVGAPIPLKPKLASRSSGESIKGSTGGTISVTPQGTTALQKFYPDNDGFLGLIERKFLMPGDRIDRYGGSNFSRFFSPQGTPKGARALPPDTANQPLRTFEVVKPFEVEAGTVSPAYGELGFGIQYRTPVRMEILIKRGIIREVD